MGDRILQFDFAKPSTCSCDISLGANQKSATAKDSVESKRNELTYSVVQNERSKVIILSFEFSDYSFTPEKGK